jgi:hypothetical protein
MLRWCLARRDAVLVELSPAGCYVVKHKSFLLTCRAR